MKIAAWILLAGLGLGLCAQDYIVNRQGQRQRVDDLVVEDGRVMVVQGGAKAPLNRNLNPFVITPEPRQVSAAQQALRQGDAKKVLALLDERVFDEYKLLGWGPIMAMLRAEAHLTLGDAPQATRELLQGRKLFPTREQAVRLNIMLARALIERQSFNEAEELLGNLETDDEEIAPRLYLMRGQIAEKRDKPREAVLEYLKVVLVYKDAGAPRKQALQRVAAILDSQRDGRSQVFKQMLQQEYP